MKMYILINKYYTDFGKLIMFFILGMGVFGFYSFYFLLRNPRLLDIKSVVQDSVQNAAIDSTMDELAQKLNGLYKEWK